MKAAPIGAFGAIAFTIGKYGVGMLVNLAWLVGSFYLTSLLFVIVILGLVSWWCGFSIFRLIRYLKAELLLVLGTSSSESALPSLMEKMERAGASKSVVGLVVPTGYSFNLDGTNIYMTLAALTFRPEAFKVGIDIFGVSNWVRTLESIPPYWEAQRKALYDEIGDPVKDADQFKATSPLQQAARRRPHRFWSGCRAASGGGTGRGRLCGRTFGRHLS